MKTLKINTSWATLEATSQRATMQISNKVRRGKVTTTPAKMTLNKEDPKMRLNWEKVWNESGRQRPGNLAQTQAADGRQASVDATIKYSADGNYVGDVSEYTGTGISPFAELAKRDAVQQAPETNLGTMPDSLPEVEWDESGMNIEWEKGDVSIEWDEDYMPEFTVTPHSVEIRLNGRPKVHISVSEDNIVSIGRKVNEGV